MGTSGCAEKCPHQFTFLPVRKRDIYVLVPGSSANEKLLMLSKAHNIITQNGLVLSNTRVAVSRT